MILAASEVIYMQRLLPDSPKVFRLHFILRFLPHVYISIYYILYASNDSQRLKICFLLLFHALSRIPLPWIMTFTDFEQNSTLGKNVIKRMFLNL